MIARLAAAFALLLLASFLQRTLSASETASTCGSCLQTPLVWSMRPPVEMANSTRRFGSIIVKAGLRLFLSLNFCDPFGQTSGAATIKIQQPAWFTQDGPAVSGYSVLKTISWTAHSAVEHLAVEVEVPADAMDGELMVQATFKRQCQFSEQTWTNWNLQSLNHTVWVDNAPSTVLPFSFRGTVQPSSLSLPYVAASARDRANVASLGDSIVVRAAFSKPVVAPHMTVRFSDGSALSFEAQNCSTIVEHHLSIQQRIQSILPDGPPDLQTVLANAVHPANGSHVALTTCRWAVTVLETWRDGSVDICVNGAATFDSVALNGACLSEFHPTDDSAATAAPDWAAQNASYLAIDRLPLPILATPQGKPLDSAYAAVAEEWSLTIVERGPLYKRGIDVVLGLQPKERVAISFVPSSTSEFVTSPTIIEFSPSNWNKPRTIFFDAIDDRVTEGVTTVFVYLKLFSRDPLFSREEIDTSNRALRFEIIVLDPIPEAVRDSDQPETTRAPQMISATLAMNRDTTTVGFDLPPALQDPASAFGSSLGPVQGFQQCDSVFAPRTMARLTPFTRLWFAALLDRVLTRTDPAALTPLRWMFDRSFSTVWDYCSKLKSDFEPQCLWDGKIVRVEYHPCVQLAGGESIALRQGRIRSSVLGVYAGANRIPVIGRPTAPLPTHISIQSTVQSGSYPSSASKPTSRLRLLISFDSFVFVDRAATFGSRGIDCSPWLYIPVLPGWPHTCEVRKPNGILLDFDHSPAFAGLGLEVLRQQTADLSSLVVCSASGVVKYHHAAAAEPGWCRAVPFSFQASSSVQVMDSNCHGMLKDTSRVDGDVLFQDFVFTELGPCEILETAQRQWQGSSQLSVGNTSIVFAYNMSASGRHSVFRIRDEDTVVDSVVATVTRVQCSTPAAMQVRARCDMYIVWFMGHVRCNVSTTIYTTAWSLAIAFAAPVCESAAKHTISVSTTVAAYGALRSTILRSSRKDTVKGINATTTAWDCNAIVLQSAAQVYARDAVVLRRDIQRRCMESSMLPLPEGWEWKIRLAAVSVLPDFAHIIADVHVALAAEAATSVLDQSSSSAQQPFTVDPGTLWPGFSYDIELQRTRGGSTVSVAGSTVGVQFSGVEPIVQGWDFAYFATETVVLDASLSTDYDRLNSIPFVFRWLCVRAWANFGASVAYIESLVNTLKSATSFSAAELHTALSVFEACIATDGSTVDLDAYTVDGNTVGSPIQSLGGAVKFAQPLGVENCSPDACTPPGVASPVGSVVKIPANTLGFGNVHVICVGEKGYRNGEYPLLYRTGLAVGSITIIPPSQSSERNADICLTTACPPAPVSVLGDDLLSLGGLTPKATESEGCNAIVPWPCSTVNSSTYNFVWNSVDPSQDLQRSIISTSRNSPTLQLSLPAWVALAGSISSLAPIKYTLQFLAAAPPLSVAAAVRLGPQAGQLRVLPSDVLQGSDLIVPAFRLETNAWIDDASAYPLRYQFAFQGSFSALDSMVDQGACNSGTANESFDLSIPIRTTFSEDPNEPVVIPPVLACQVNSAGTVPAHRVLAFAINRYGAVSASPTVEVPRLMPLGAASELCATGAVPQQCGLQISGQVCNATAECYRSIAVELSKLGNAATLVTAESATALPNMLARYQQTAWLVAAQPVRVTPTTTGVAPIVAAKSFHQSAFRGTIWSSLLRTHGLAHVPTDSLPQLQWVWLAACPGSSLGDFVATEWSGALQPAQSCSGHGACIRNPRWCSILDIGCAAHCACSTGWAGNACELNVGPSAPIKLGAIAVESEIQAATTLLELSTEAAASNQRMSPAVWPHTAHQWERHLQLLTAQVVLQRLRVAASLTDPALNFNMWVHTIQAAVQMLDTAIERMFDSTLRFRADLARLALAVTNTVMDFCSGVARESGDESFVAACLQTNGIPPARTASPRVLLASRWHSEFDGAGFVADSTLQIYRRLHNLFAMVQHMRHCIMRARSVLNSTAFVITSTSNKFLQVATVAVSSQALYERRARSGSPFRGMIHSHTVLPVQPSMYSALTGISSVNACGDVRRCTGGSVFTAIVNTTSAEMKPSDIPYDAVEVQFDFSWNLFKTSLPPGGLGASYFLRCIRPCVNSTQSGRKAVLMSASRSFAGGVQPICLSQQGWTTLQQAELNVHRHIQTIMENQGELLQIAELQSYAAATLLAVVTLGAATVAVAVAVCSLRRDGLVKVSQEEFVRFGRSYAGLWRLTTETLLTTKVVEHADSTDIYRAIANTGKVARTTKSTDLTGILLSIHVRRVVHHSLIASKLIISALVPCSRARSTKQRTAADEPSWFIPKGILFVDIVIGWLCSILLVSISVRQRPYFVEHPLHLAGIALVVFAATSVVLVLLSAIQLGWQAHTERAQRSCSLRCCRLPYGCRRACCASRVRETPKSRALAGLFAMQSPDNAASVNQNPEAAPDSGNAPSQSVQLDFKHVKIFRAIELYFTAFCSSRTPAKGCCKLPPVAKLCILVYASVVSVIHVPAVLAGVAFRFSLFSHGGEHLSAGVQLVAYVVALASFVMLVVQCIAWWSIHRSVTWSTRISITLMCSFFVLYVAVSGAAAALLSKSTIVLALMGLAQLTAIAVVWWVANSVRAIRASSHQLLGLVDKQYPVRLLQKVTALQHTVRRGWFDQQQGRRLMLREMMRRAPTWWAVALTVVAWMLARIFICLLLLVATINLTISFGTQEEVSWFLAIIVQLALICLLLLPAVCGVITGQHANQLMMRGDVVTRSYIASAMRSAVSTTAQIDPSLPTVKSAVVSSTPAQHKPVALPNSVSPGAQLAVAAPRPKSSASPPAATRRLRANTHSPVSSPSAVLLTQGRRTARKRTDSVASTRAQKHKQRSRARSRALSTDFN